MAAKDIPRQQTFIDTVKALRAPPTETDDGWMTVGDTGDELAPPFQNSWHTTPGGTPVAFFVAPDGLVKFRGTIEGGASGTVAFNLPVGYRPEKTEYFIAPSILGPGISQVKVDPSGDVTIYTDLGVDWGSISGTPSTFVADPGADGFWKTVAGAITKLSSIPWSNLSSIPTTFTPDPGSNGYWKTVAGVLTKLASVPWADLSGIPSTFAPSAHQSSHQSGGGDALTGNVDANARVGTRKNSAGSTFLRRRLNFIEGSNVTITVTDDSTDEEVDVTISSTGGGGGGGNITTDTAWNAKGDLIVATANDTAAVLTVGSDGQVLLADSTQTSGVRWGDIDGGSP